MFHRMLGRRFRAWRLARISVRRARRLLGHSRVSWLRRPETYHSFAGFAGALVEPMKSREEQLTWAKLRALICADMGDFTDAVAGCRADLDENP